MRVIILLSLRTVLVFMLSYTFSIVARLRRIAREVLGGKKIGGTAIMRAAYR
jgi:hypothetical protein